MKIRDKVSWLQLIVHVLQKTPTDLDFPTYNNTIFHQNPMCGLFFYFCFMQITIIEHYNNHCFLHYLQTSLQNDAWEHRLNL